MKLPLDLRGATTLIIRNNDNMINLHFSDLEELKMLIIKNNNELTHLKIPKLHWLKDIRIDNNDKLKNIELSEPLNINLGELVPESWKLMSRGFENIRRVLFNKPDLVIQRNDCLENLTFENMNNLRELRIVGNRNLTEINLGTPPNGEAPATGPPP